MWSWFWWFCIILCILFMVAGVWITKKLMYPVPYISVRQKVLCSALPISEKLETLTQALPGTCIIDLRWSLMVIVPPLSCLVYFWWWQYHNPLSLGSSCQTDPVKLSFHWLVLLGCLVCSGFVTVMLLQSTIIAY